ncbi:PREDICTED: uncharacterized protein LOC104821804 [Tarenaya hassleriana]|uniref:uncharacterized protein LOC104821804 n=1 Tax=Tarenaya hassleriana TaxID=28532 RepID=UPI00053C8431|nr:PREDICTED: uncharacterized protein LOC104821804 [Tarenaya hassleriana]
MDKEERDTFTLKTTQKPHLHANPRLHLPNACHSLSLSLSLSLSASPDFDLQIVIPSFSSSPNLSRMEGPAMDWKNEEYPSEEGGGKMGWIWSNGMSLGKKFLTAGVVVSSAPFVVPPLVIVSMFAMISSVPYCLFLASYACTQKLMNALLPSPSYFGGNEETVGIENDECGYEEGVMDDSKHGHVDVDGEGDETSLGEAGPVLIQIEGEDVTVTNMGEDPTLKVTDRVVAVYDRPVASENEETEKETKKLVESIRDEVRTDEVHGRTPEKVLQEDEKPIGSRDAESERTRVEDVAEKKERHETENVGEKGEANTQKLDEHEGELEPTVTETSNSAGKHEETTQNEPLDRAVDAPR